MVCEECKKYKRLAEVNVEDLKKYIKEHKEFEKALKSVVTTIVKEKVEEPEMLYTYPDRPMTERDIAEWFDATECMYHFAKRWEEQERGWVCSVDRAYGKYLIPECKKLLEHLAKVNK
jgi:hypothetical protein